jgi:hypothetical protein
MQARIPSESFDAAQQSRLSQTCSISSSSDLMPSPNQPPLNLPIQSHLIILVRDLVLVF